MTFIKTTQILRYLELNDNLIFNSVKFILAFVVYDFNDTSKVGPTARKQDTVLSLIVTPGAMTIFSGEGYNLNIKMYLNS